MNCGVMQHNRASLRPSCSAGQCLPHLASRSALCSTRHTATCTVGQGTRRHVANVLSSTRAASNASLRNSSISAYGASNLQSPSGSQTASEDKPSVENIKAQLLDSLYGTERGLSASMEVRGEISELICQLEAANPNNDDPNDAQLLGGTWKLVYTVASELGALLALSRLPFVTVGDITQAIDVATGRVVNKVVLSDLFTKSAFSSTANFEVRSPKLLSIKFVSGALATPQLLQDVDLPQSITVMGQNVDLTGVRESLSPVRKSVQSAVSQVSAFLEGRPDTSFDLPEQVQAQSWLLTTYIDEDVRIARGDGGAVFVLVRESQPVTRNTPLSGTLSGNDTPSGTGGFGTYGTGAWKDDPIGNRPPSASSPAGAPSTAPPGTVPAAVPFGGMGAAPPPPPAVPGPPPVFTFRPPAVSTFPPTVSAAPPPPPAVPPPPPAVTYRPPAVPSPPPAVPQQKPAVGLRMVAPSSVAPPPPPQSQKSALPPSIAPVPAQPPTPNTPGAPKGPPKGPTVKPTSLTVEGVGGAGRKVNPGDVLGTSLGQRKSKNPKKKGGGPPQK